MTLPAPGKGTLALDGTAASTDQVIAAADLGKLTFEPAAHGHGDPYATFTFKVSDGILESASAYTMTVDVTAVNDAATGAPAISGTARKGLTLIASKGTVADADGLTRAEGGEAGHAYSWQWIRVDGETETAISAATSKTYTLVAADVGKKVKVKVSFSDDDGNDESRTSAAYPSGDGGGFERADRGGQDGDAGRGHVLRLQGGGFRVRRQRHGRRAVERQGGDAAGLGQGDAGAGRHGGDGGAVGDEGGSGCGRSRLRACGARPWRPLRGVHLQGERRHSGERLGLHHDGRRDGCERRGDGCADDLGDGAGGADAHRVEEHGRRRRRSDQGGGRRGRPRLQLAVDPRRRRDGDGDLGGDVQDLHGWWRRTWARSSRRS